MLENVMAVLGSLGGLTGVISLFHIKAERKAKELDNVTKDLDNEAKQSEEWRKLYEEERQYFQEARRGFDETIKEKDALIDSLYNEIANQRNLKVELHDKIANMTVELTKLRLLKCESVNCVNRKPPTGY